MSGKFSTFCLAYVRRRSSRQKTQHSQFSSSVSTLHTHIPIHLSDTLLTRFKKVSDLIN